MLRAEIQLAWKTRAGHRHHLEGLDNEDAVYVTRDHPLFDALMIVADGMGGHPRPREAAETAVRAASHYLEDPAVLKRLKEVPQALRTATAAAHDEVRALQGGAARRHPGTTLSIAAVADGMLYVSHVGDGSVFLMRAGQVRMVAGGEERRTGNRPAQFLGQSDPLQPEEQRYSLVEGDRILLCTDGLTRYFGEAGPEALERVIGRQGVEIGSVASQLTAHSRPDEYDDDTTVALAEVTALVQAARAAEPEPGDSLVEATSGRRSAARPAPASRAALWSLPAAALTGAALLAVGFLGGRLTAPREKVAESGTPAAAREPAAAKELNRLPEGNVVLMDRLGHRVLTLATRNKPFGTDPVELQAFNVGSNGQFTPSHGSFRLDPTRGELTDADGHVYPVEVDYSGGALRILRGGTLVVNTHPAGARISIDGRAYGASPVTAVLPAGPHKLRAETRGWQREWEGQVLAGQTVTLTLKP